MMMGNHQMSCTFTMQQIGRLVVTHSKADSNLHGHYLAISRKQCLCGFSEPALKPSIRTLGSLRISGMAYH